MTEREKLIELLNKRQQQGIVYIENQMDSRYSDTIEISNNELADYLIENGVTIKACETCMEYKRYNIKEVKKMTNFEKIKTMSVKEMAYYFCTDLPICPLKAPHCKDNNCPVCFELWLESEVIE